jgi:hypothetical protein
MKELGELISRALKERGKWVVANRSGKQGGDRRGGHCCCRQALAAEQEQWIAASRLDSAGIQGVVRGRWLTGNEAAYC